MKTGLVHLFVVLFAIELSYTFVSARLNKTVSAYYHGVDMGIIDPDKYPLESFRLDEEYVFKDTYRVYTSLNISESRISYRRWLVMNNYGILPDTQESMFEPKAVTRSGKKKYKNEFLQKVRQGDILITTKSNGPLCLHAALMTTDYWVLDFAGGRGWRRGMPDNNRQMGKDKWYDQFADRWTHIYRFDRYPNEAQQAAVWADQNYFNPVGGGQKMIHITCKLTRDFYSIDPSYPGKLIVQAYYHATNLVSKQAVRRDPLILPMNMKNYFKDPNSLKHKGRY